MQGSERSSRGGRAPVAPQAQKSKADRTHKAIKEPQADRPFKSAIKKPPINKGQSNSPAQRSVNRTYRRFNFTKQRSAFRETPNLPQGRHKPTDPAGTPAMLTKNARSHGRNFPVRGRITPSENALVLFFDRMAQTNCRITSHSILTPAPDVVKRGNSLFTAYSQRFHTSL